MENLVDNINNWFKVLTELPTEPELNEIEQEEIEILNTYELNKNTERA